MISSMFEPVKMSFSISVGLLIDGVTAAPDDVGSPALDVNNSQACSLKLADCRNITESHQHGDRLWKSTSRKIRLISKCI